MKTKRSLVTFSVVGFMALLLCLPLAEVMAGGNNPGIPIDYKQQGPQVKGQLIVGWDEYDTPTAYGTVEGYLLVGGELYAGIVQKNVKEEDFLDLGAVDLVKDDFESYWVFPTALADLYGMPRGTLVVVLEEKDVLSFEMIKDLPASPPYNFRVVYDHAFISEIKLTFLVPK